VTALTTAWMDLAICAAMIGVAGPFLTRYGDIIGRRTGLSRTWVGLTLLATATSLPELFTGISAVTIADTPNIAVGDALGSCVFNLAMLAVLDAMQREEPMFSRMEVGHILTAGFGVILVGVTGAALLLGANGFGPKFFHIGVYTPILIVLYFVSMRTAFVYDARRPLSTAAKSGKTDVSLVRAIFLYLLAAIIVAGAGAWLPFVGAEIADTMGWRMTFVGTLFVAAATSMPELVVTTSALRLGALDMAIANLLGSNLFAVFIIAIDDLAYRRDSLFEAVSPTHAVTAFAVVIMSGIVIVALLFRPTTRFQGVISWASLSLSIVYLLSSYAVFLYGH
jgi:cation:H+ antiporter